MTILCLILFLCVAALWFFINEYPTLFGIYVPTCAVKRVWFKFIAAASMLVAIAVSGHCAVGESVSACLPLGRIDCKSMLICLIATLITLFTLKFFTITGAGVYALLGALEAFAVTSGQGSDWHMFLSFLIAPAFAFLLSAGIRLTLRLTLDKCHIHMITLSYYLRYVVITAIMATAFAVGLNWGGFLLAVSGMSGVSGPMTIIIPVTALLLICLSATMRTGSDESAGRFSDFSIWSVLAVGFSTVLTLLFFSFGSTTGLLHLIPAPLSVGSLIFAGIAGSEVVQKTILVEREEYIKEIAALIAAPFGTFLIAYIILSVSGYDDENLVDFTVMSAAMIILLALLFGDYVRRQRAQEKATERLVYSQQQQIYENSRALNEMELKVVLSENQALHNSIEQKKQEVMNVALSIVEQKEFLESLDEKVKTLAKADDLKEKDRLISELGLAIKQRLSYDRDVDSQYFYAQAESLHEDFNAKLSENFPNLTQQEKRLATLLRLGFSSKYIATLMNITPKSVEISRYRLRQKLGLSKGDNLVNYIKSI